MILNVGIILGNHDVSYSSETFQTAISKAKAAITQTIGGHWIDTQQVDTKSINKILRQVKELHHRFTDNSYHHHGCLALTELPNEKKLRDMPKIRVYQDAPPIWALATSCVSDRVLIFEFDLRTP